MSKNPEGKFYEAVERQLKPDVYCEGMANPYRGGTPDRFYEGPFDDFWVEYKWYAKLPVRGINLVSGKSPKLSPLQEEWLDRRVDHGHENQAVIIGFPGEKRHEKLGIIMVNKEWKEFLPALQYDIKTVAQIASWIRERVL